MSYRFCPNHTAVHPVCPGYKMTIFDGGRLGNKMGEFATLLAHSKRLGFEPVLTPSMKTKFNEIFKSISFPGKRLYGKPYTVEELSNVTSCKQLPKTVKIDPVMFLKPTKCTNIISIVGCSLTCSLISAAFLWTCKAFTLTWRTFGENLPSKMKLH